jgi:hypothetical protein
MALNPWFILGALVALGSLVGGVGYKAYQMGKDSIIAAQAKEHAAVQRTVDAMIAAGAKEVSRINGKNKPIIQTVEHKTLERIYVDCKSDPSVMRDFNAIVTGAPDPAGSVQLPPTDTDR